jgi:hypothetical protein
MKGLNPQHDAIQAVYTQTAEYKAAKEAEARRADLDRAVTEIEAITQTYRENAQRGAIPTAKQIEAETAHLTQAIAGLGAVGPQRRIYTLADYMTECLTYDPMKDFRSVLFGGLAFPNGTTSYIGARTSRGKTTAMVNLAREAMHYTQRKVIFITLEMSRKQILNKLILSTAYFYATVSEPPEDPVNRRALLFMNPGRDIYQVWQRGPIVANKEESDIFRFHVNDAYERISSAQRDGFFTLYDGRGATEAEIISFIKAQGDADTLILLDYIQKMPPKGGADADSFRRVQAISYDVVNAAAATNAVIIAGAQFNRLRMTDKAQIAFEKGIDSPEKFEEAFMNTSKTGNIIIKDSTLIGSPIQTGNGNTVTNTTTTTISADIIREKLKEKGIPEAQIMAIESQITELTAELTKETVDKGKLQEIFLKIKEVGGVFLVSAFAFLSKPEAAEVIHNIVNNVKNLLGG